MKSSTTPYTPKKRMIKTIQYIFLGNIGWRQTREESLLFLLPRPWGAQAMASDPNACPFLRSLPLLLALLHCSSSRWCWECLRRELGLGWILALSLDETASAGRYREGERPSLPGLELCALPLGTVNGLQSISFISGALAWGPSGTVSFGLFI